MKVQIANMLRSDGLLSESTTAVRAPPRCVEFENLCCELLRTPENYVDQFALGPLGTISLLYVVFTH